MNRKNCVSGIFWSLFFIFAMYLDSQTGGNASYWPGMISTLGLCLSLVFTAGAALRWKSEAGGKVLPFTADQGKRLGISFGLLLAWILCMNLMGFLVSSVVFLVVFYLIFEPVKSRKNLVRDAVTAAVFGIGMYLLFTALGISFPRGIFI